MSISTPDGDTARNRFVGLGLFLVALGWLALVADLALASAQLQAGSLVAVLSLKSDIATLSEMLIVTGLGLAILGGLRDGFGALSRFFDAVLQRSAAARTAPVPPPVDLDTGFSAASRSPAERGVAPPPSSPERNYQIRPDGSVEVETLLGTRVFASMEEARDFIR